jgi:very-short-patch-repair endonuclease
MRYSGGMANELARTLRKRMTRHEVRLWLRLRELRALGFHFRRQVAIKDCIVDFACYHPRVVIELDGSQHSTRDFAARDAARDAKLTTAGFKIFRVWNNEVEQNLDGVLEKLLHELEHS